MTLLRGRGLGPDRYGLVPGTRSGGGGMTDPGRFEDDRGVIRDLLVTPLDGVTEIRTRKGAIRGTTCTARRSSTRTWCPGCSGW